MLYASSLLIGRVIKVGITDTDDGKEEFVTKSQIKDILSRGIEVKNLSYLNGVVGVFIRTTDSILISGCGYDSMNSPEFHYTF